jgi:hypothetical protein
MLFCYTNDLVIFRAFGAATRFPNEFVTFGPVGDFLVSFYIFCCTIFVRDVLMRCHAFLGRYEL